MVWPAQKVQATPLHGLFEPSTSVEALSMVPISNINDPSFKFQAVVLKSWMWQCGNFQPPFLRTRKPCVAFISDGEEDTFIKVLCRKAGWKMCRAKIVAYAMAAGFNYAEALSLFAFLLQLIQDVLGIDEEAALEILYVRVAMEEDRETIMEECLLEFDDILDVVDHQDLGRYQEQKTHSRNERAERAAFRHEYFKTKRAQRQRKDGVAKGKGKGKEPAPPPKKKLKIDAHTTQKQAKEWTPKGSSIWVAKSGRWCGHCPPNKRVSAKFSDHKNSEEASRACLRKLWTQACLRDGMTHDEIPFDGVFVK